MVGPVQTQCPTVTPVLDNMIQVYLIVKVLGVHTLNAWRLPLGDSLWYSIVYVTQETGDPEAE